MRTLKLSIVSLFGLILSTSSVANAQQPANQVRTGVGVGAEATTTGLVGGTFVYDAGVFHVDALLGGEFARYDSRVAVAGRLFFPLHRGQAADFSIGPGIGIVHRTEDPDGAGPGGSVSGNEVHAEAAVQVRAFVVSNVALSASAGLGMVFTEGTSRAQLGGQVGGSFGVTYFFF